MSYSNYGRHWANNFETGSGNDDFQYPGCSVTLSRTTDLDRFLFMRNCPQQIIHNQNGLSYKELFLGHTSTGVDVYPFVSLINEDNDGHQYVQINNIVNSEFGCPPLYELHDNLCLFVDQCAIYGSNCSIVETCINTPEGYTCVPTMCDYVMGTWGYELNVETGKCDDIDECLIEKNGEKKYCNGPNEVCVNKERGWTCKTLCEPECNESELCLENNGILSCVDECATASTCSNTEECSNTVDGHTCKEIVCGEGYYLNVDSGSCEENVCNSGYTQGNEGCEDIDECLNGQNNCATANEICVNTPGSFRCDCAPGYIYTDYEDHEDFEEASNGYCGDINECDDGSDLCAYRSEVCVNTDGGHYCVCATGHEGVTENVEDSREGDFEGCIDINECSLGEHNCDWSEGEACINWHGSWYCTCRSGFYYNNINNNYDPWGTTWEGCRDRDECSYDAGNDCDSQTEDCVNTKGSYECTCKNGYNMVDDSCVDIDECTTMTATCSSNETCSNTEGSYICAPKTAVEDLYNTRMFPDDLLFDIVEYNPTSDSIRIEYPTGWDLSYVFFKEPNLASITVTCAEGSVECNYYLGFIAAEQCPDPEEGLYSECEDRQNEAYHDLISSYQSMVTFSSIHGQQTLPDWDMNIETFSEPGESLTVIHGGCDSHCPNAAFKTNHGTAEIFWSTVKTSSGAARSAGLIKDNEFENRIFYPFIAMMSNSDPIEITAAVLRSDENEIICSPYYDLIDGECVKYDICERDSPCGDGICEITYSGYSCS